MRLLPIAKIIPGMKLGKKIYNSDGLVLLNEGVELSSSLIKRLGDHGVDFVYISDPRTDDIVIRELISDETRAAAISGIKQSFRTAMEDHMKRKAVGALQVGKVFRNLLTMILDDLSSHKDAMIMLTNIHTMDDYLYQHSLNVCIYSTMLGMAHGYSREELMTLGLGSLLHDIGKTQIPIQLLRKNDRLTDEEYLVIKKHAEFGYRFLKDEPNIPLLSAHCAFQHHERVDGSGYPRGLKGDEIHEYARWIGLVDSYDAMTTHRVYRRAMLPHQAMEILYAGTGTLYDMKKIELFRDKIAIYPLGVTVTLNTGETGVVCDLNPSVPHRPTVRILKNAYGEDIQSPFDIDLSQQMTLLITGVGEENAVTPV
ncbi:HD-GYP domain-containing protein [Paenibacillus silviterrae]|uniref:HD-GYP domain-containing protein n=1 Tax=Paenibacillus silviterrae TaxID=3242194 RepID=UPI00254326F4|nr:HD-GYP domain-containing protein [Paenibacillus chinjuensis]